MSEIGMIGVRAIGGGGDGGGGGGGDDGFGARFLATPGLTPILPARTPDAAIGGYGGGGGGGGVGGGGGDGPGEEEDTPSMFLSGLLRGSSSGAVGASVGAAAAAAAAAATDEGDAEGASIRGGTPVHVDGRAMGAAGVRAARMAAVGYGVTRAGATGGGAGAGAGAGAGGYGAREAYTRGEAAGAGAGTGGGGGRVTRGAGGRRIGGRLSFSSALGLDDGSGEEGTAAAGGGQEESASTGGSTTGARVSGRRWVVGLGPGFVCFALFCLFHGAREREQRSVSLM